MSKLGLLLVAALASLPLVTQAARLQPDPARLSIDVKMLSSDAFEGREPGTRAEKKTVLFIIDRMKEAGLQPGGTLVVNGGMSAGRAHREDYYAHRYHQPGDEWTPSMDFRGEALDVTLLYNLGKKLAASGWPQWNTGSEFKAGPG